MQAAFIMQARTRNNDYIGTFLVAPVGFPEEEKAKVYDFVNDKTKYIDVASSEGIKITFCNDEFIVLGIGIITENLYKKCKKEAKYVQIADGRRRVYAFLGFVFKRNEVHKIFDITYELLLEYYERYMSELCETPFSLWEMPFSYEPMKPVSSQYEELPFTKISDASRTAVSLTSEMLKKLLEMLKKHDKPDNTASGENKSENKNGNKNGFNIIAAIVLIGISIAAVILGTVLMKNFVQDKSVHQIVLPQQNDNKVSN